MMDGTDYAQHRFLLTRLMRGVTRGVDLNSSPTVVFLLTRLMRGVTGFDDAGITQAVDFYSHASCEA